MKKVIIILAILTSYVANAQSFQVFGIDTSNYPRMSAKFYAFDEDGNQLTNFSPSDFELIENGIQREVLHVSCPDPKQHIPISVAMSIDVSGSMSHSNFGDIPVELGKLTARELCNFVDMPPSEFALQTCHDKAYIIQDFTTNKEKVINSINTVKANGDNDFFEQLLNKLTGLLNISKTGKYKRIAVIYTDAWWYALTTSELQECKDICDDFDIEFYAVIYSRPEAEENGIKKSLKEIAEYSGGKFYDGVTSQDAAKDIAKIIQENFQNSEPCNIEWESEVDCNYLKKVEINLKPLNLVNKVNYQVNILKIASLKIQPNYVLFKNIETGQKIDTIIRVTAKGSDFNVFNIKYIETDFTITPTNFQLKEGETQELQLTFSNNKESYSFSSFEFETNQCNSLFYASGGSNQYSTGEKNINLMHPNGNEIFLVGSDTTTTWEGTLPDEFVKIDFSNNAGKNWINLTQNANDYVFNWKNLPGPESDSCLIKVSKKIEPLVWSNLLINGKAIEYSPDASMVAFTCFDGVVIIDSSFTNLIQKIHLENDTYSLAWHPDGSLLSISEYWGKILTYNTTNWNKIYEIKNMSVDYFYNELKWSPDGNILAALNISRVYLHNKEDGSRIRSISLNGLGSSFTWSPSSEFIAYESFTGLYRAYAQTGTSINTFMQNTQKINSIDWSPDGNRIISGGENKIIRIWDSNNLTLSHSINTGEDIRDLHYSDGGEYFVSLSDTGNIRIYDSNSFQYIRQMNDNVQINDISWKNYELPIVSTGKDLSIRKWDINKREIINSIYGSANYSINDLSWSTDNRYIISGGKGVKLWNTNNGFGTKMYGESIDNVKSVSFNPDNTKFVSTNHNNTIRIWETDGKLPLVEFEHEGGSIVKAEWSKDPNRFAVAYSSREIVIYNSVNGSIVNNFQIPDGVSTFAWSNDGFNLAIGHGNGKISIINSITGEELYELNGHNETINSLSFNLSNDSLASVDNDGLLKIWDITNELEVFSTEAHIIKNKCVSWQPNGNRIATIGLDKNIKIWNSNTGQLETELIGHENYINSIKWNHPGNLIASADEKGVIKVWNVNIEDNTDISDNLFSIVIPKTESQDVDMREALVQTVKDSVINEFIFNVSNWDVKIDSIYFRGADAGAFQLVSGIPSYTVEAENSHHAEFRFMPQEARRYNAEIVIITQAEILTQNITGIGVEKKILVAESLIDFGKVKLNDFKDTIQTVTIRNIGSMPFEIKETKHNYPNATDFTTLAGGGNFTLQPDETHLMDLRFTPSDVGRTTGTLEFHYDGVGSPAIIQLFGEGLPLFPDIEITYFGFEKLVCESETSSLIDIKNKGEGDLIIDNIEIQGLHSSEFELQNINYPILVKPDSTYQLEITFNPITTGNKTAQIVLFNNTELMPEYVFSIAGSKESVGLDFEVPYLYMGETYPNQTLNGTFKIINKGAKDINWATPIISNEFTITEITPNPIPAGGEAIANVEFYALDSNNYITTIQYIDECGELSEIQLEANVNAYERADLTISIDDYSAFAGDEIEVPIILDNQANLQFSGVASLSVELTFNPTLLYPKEYTVERIDDKTAKIRIDEIPVEVESGNVLKTVKFIAALGNAEECVLALSNAEAVGGEAEITVESGQFTLLGICEEGGMRLINPTAKAGISSISPNPTDGKIEIALNLIEKGFSELAIFNSLGEKVYNNAMTNHGTEHLNIDASQYSNGIYFVVLITPSHIFEEKLIIMK